MRRPYISWRAAEYRVVEFTANGEWVWGGRDRRELTAKIEKGSRFHLLDPYQFDHRFMKALTFDPPIGLNAGDDEEMQAMMNRDYERYRRRIRREAVESGDVVEALRSIRDDVDRLLRRLEH